MAAEQPTAVPLRRTMRWLLVLGLLLLAVLGVQTWRDPHFWVTAAQRGDALMAARQFEDAAAAYDDPWRIGVAQYRNGDFEDAAATFARVPGAAGAFDQGNARLMHGDYDGAIDSYDRALGFRPGWRQAEDNQALARARKARIDDAGADRDQESAGAYKPDDTVFDQEGQDSTDDPPQDMNEQQVSDEALRATWLRKVQTTPGDFLRAKFAYQAAQGGRQPPAPAPQGDER